ncbi:MAG TPA: SDR family oxidoreductase [Pseudomonadales bacterium]|nr:short-chain dehydrogenase [Gammaproteobacteria bacterium]MDP6027339.1 SDR family oxidoreductase [Pseudomonadales bacterium]MBP17939.1 short-chain dehydrogenase [Gammaproteobacteria bacterium]MDP6317026.1 SDR family oxidoreductase [Pseudomonadales bacterium]MDP7316201.1 SDR family oxidoreductase [Pseudomonadales bacterium]
MTEESVLITGAGSGMGRLAAQNMAKAGYQIAALDVDEKGLLETAEGFQNIRTFQTDVTDHRAVTDVVNETELTLGPIRRVYNAAGIMPLGTIESVDIEVFHRVMAINYNGVVNVTKAVLPPLLARNEGEIVNFASIAGWLPTVYMAAYDASKFAVVAFTEVLYHENKNNNLSIACVCPPPVKTPLLQQARDTVWPKVFDQGAHIEAQEVLDAIDESLANNELFVFPGKGTKSIWRMRRWFPRALWKNILKIEGI